MNFRKLILILLLSLIVPACSPGTAALPTGVPATASETFTPFVSLPDLVLSNIYLGMQGFPGTSIHCVPSYGPLEIRVTLQNLGSVPVYNIPVLESSTGASLTVGELAAWGVMELYFPATSPTGTYTIIVDEQNLILESDESNNSLSYLAPTPTPPALCSPTPPPFESTPVPSLTPTPFLTSIPDSSALSETALRNAVYRSPDFGEYQLTDGVYYRTPPTSQESPETYTTRFHGLISDGDINLDGLQDALVLLNTQNGGTGHLIELAAVLNQNGIPNNVATVSLGDRVVVESAAVENGTITLNMRVHGPNDGLCCPSQPATWTFVLRGDQLIKLQ